MRKSVIGLALLAIATLSPSLVCADDQAIADALLSKLQSHKQEGTLKGFAVDLQVDSGAVLLTGKVRTEQQLHLVLDAARRIQGVKQVVNDLKIQDSTGDRPGLLSKLNPRKLLPIVQVSTPTDRERESAKSGDDEIARAVIAKLQILKDNRQLRDFDLDLEVDKGSVWIKGRVASSKQQWLVLDAARRVAGVRQVVNDLSIKAALRAPAPIVSRNHARDFRTQPVSNVTTSEPEVIGSAVETAQPAPVVSQMAPMGAPHYVMTPRHRAPNMPLAFAPAQSVAQGQAGQPMPMHLATNRAGQAPARHDQPQLPGYAWPSYAPHPNYGSVAYPKQYSPSAWPYIGPFYPYPQVPLGWRKVVLEWDDGWWMLDFDSK